MKTRADYYALQDELQALEKTLRATHGVWFALSDQCVDAENILPLREEDNFDEYWAAMYRAACMQAGMMAEEAGLDINALLGRVIY